MNSSISSVNDLKLEVNKLYSKMNAAYNNNKSKLTESEQVLVESTLGVNSTYLDKVSDYPSPEEKSLLDISRSQKKKKK